MRTSQAMRHSLNYQQAEAKLNGKDYRKVGNNTTLERRDADTIALRLHGTDVVLFHFDGSVTLDSGGWQTVTTKDRFNWCADIAVASERGEWRVAFGARGWWSGNYYLPFYDGIRVTPEGVRVLPEGVYVD